MNIPYPEFLLYKNTYCITYLGFSIQYLLCLKHLRPYLESAYPDVEIWLCCKDIFKDVFKDEKNVCFKSDLYKRKFGYVNNLGNGSLLHPIEDLFKEAKVPIPVLSKRCDSSSKLCGIYPTGTLPVIGMKLDNIARARRFAESCGFEVQIEPNINDIGWAIGVENEHIVKAALNGIKIDWIDNSGHFNFYKQLFPDISLCKNI